MFTIVFVSMLFAVPGGLLFVLDPNSDPIKILERRAKFAAAQSRDKSGIHSRLVELGRSSELDYENFRIRQIDSVQQVPHLYLFFS